MNSLIIIAMILIVYWKVRNQYYNRLTTQYSYKLYDLRDSLRDLAVEKKVNSEDWRFKCLDSSISKTIHELPSLNLYTSLLLFLRYRKDKGFITHKTNFTKEISLDKNYLSIYDGYGQITFMYIYKKHIWLNLLLSILVALHLVSRLFLGKIIKRTKSDAKKAIGFIRIAPETSTTFNFCP